jgi:hypothetical protein
MIKMPDLESGFFIFKQTDLITVQKYINIINYFRKILDGINSAFLWKCRYISSNHELSGIHHTIIRLL